MALSRSQKRKLKQATADAREVLGHPASVRFICRILSECGYDGDPYTGDRRTDYNLGRRATGLRIVAALESADADAYLKLLQTAANERRKDADAPTTGDEEYEVH